MNKDLELWQFALSKLEKGESIILLVVVESTGSSPGRPGFKMMVTENELCGSIGGGVMEISLVEGAKLLIKNANQTTKILEKVHKKNVANSSGMICSGKQTVILRQMTKGDLDQVREIIERFDKPNSTFLQVTEKVLHCVELSNFSFNHFYRRFKKDSFIYQEKLGYKHHLFIIGGGHCALALSEFMSKLDFHISLFDDRPNLNTLNKNRFAHSKRIIDSYENIVEFIPSGEENYVVVMTLGYKFDEIVIRQLFDRNFKYFGVLGSKAKMKILLKTLEKEGFDKKRLAQIHTPIGIPINSHTPEEIAISIAAEIIAVKNSEI